MKSANALRRGRGAPMRSIFGKRLPASTGTLFKKKLRNGRSPVRLERAKTINDQRCEFGVDCPECAGDRRHCELQPDRKYFRISQSHRPAGETGLCENVSCFVVTRAHISQSHEKLPYENNGLLELFARFTGWPVSRANKCHLTTRLFARLTGWPVNRANNLQQSRSNQRRSSHGSPAGRSAMK